MTSSLGKRFESGFVKGLKTQYPLVERMADKMATAKTKDRFIPASHRTPFDILVWGDRWHMAIECKAVKGKSIPHDRLQEHQRFGLHCVNSAGDTCMGLVAVCFHEGRMDKARAFLIPINWWIAHVSVEEATFKRRKSIPMQWCIDNIAKGKIIELVYQKGGTWTLPAAS